MSVESTGCSAGLAESVSAKRARMLRFGTP